MITIFSEFKETNESSNNLDYKYKPGDFLLINKRTWNLSIKNKIKTQIIIYVTYISSIIKHEKLYMGIQVPKKEGDNELHFKEDDVIKKLNTEEVDLYLNANKFNL